MEDGNQQVYNSDSEGGEPGDIDGLSEEIGAIQMNGWIQWFCSLEGHEFLVDVEEEFIKDSFN